MQQLKKPTCITKMKKSTQSCRIKDHKRSREYIYQILEKVHFPIQEIDGVTEKKGNIVDFTSKTRRAAENLAEALSTLGCLRTSTRPKVHGCKISLGSIGFPRRKNKTSYIQNVW